MKYLLTTLVLAFVFLSTNAGAQTEAQDPGWQWGKLSNIENSSWNMGIRTDLFNDIYTYERYIDTIYIEDTVFLHSGGWPNYSDYHIAVIKRNSEGEFVKAIDLFTPQNSKLYFADMEIDSESNIYLFGEFEDTLFINDTIILPINEISYSDLYLLKLDKNLDFKWAQVISSKYSDNLGRLVISKANDIYLSAYNMNSYDTVYRFVNFFNQDSAEIFTGLVSLLKLDTKGKIIWRNEIRQPYYGYTFLRSTTIGDDGNIYLAGNASSDLYIQGDTLKYQSESGFYNKDFIIKFDPDGLFKDAFFHSIKGLSVIDTWLNIDKNSNYFISAVIYDSVIFGTDTIVVSNNSNDYLVAKMDTSFYPIWYQLVLSPNGGLQPFQIDLINDSLAFAFHGKSYFTFMDSLYAYNSNGQVLTGMFSPEGDLEEFQITEASYGTKLNNFYLDNCGNIMLEGDLQGTAHYGGDTINAGFGFHRFLAKNNRNPLSNLEMPAETTGCGQVTLYAPEGYLYYQWNDELSGQNWFIVDSSTIINVKAANEDGCWSEAETIANIYPVIEFSLGYDTTILLTDTLELSAPAGYENYFWSTGDTTSNLLVPGTELQIGDNLIWLELNNGPCSASDTIMVRVIDNSLVQENERPDILLYPNPAETKFQIILQSGEVPESISIYNCDGKRVLKLHPTYNQIEIRSLEHGVYIVELEFHDFAIRRKLIVL